MDLLRKSFFAAVGCVALFFIAAATHGVSAQSAATAAPDASKACPPAPSGPHERYHLPPTKSELPEGVSFATDWTNNQTGGWAGEQVMDRCRFQPDGFLTWHGKPAVRVEVQPQDDPLAMKNNSERAEMLQMQDTAGRLLSESGVQYYAMSYYFPAMWRGQQLRWSSFAPKDCSSGDQYQCNSWSVVWQFYYWGGLIAGRVVSNEMPQYRFFDATGGLVALGKWTDFVFRVDWTTGQYEGWRRDEGQNAFRRVFNGKVAPPSRAVYIKQGLYRGGYVDGRTDVLWIGPTVRGTSFAAVERHAFGTDSGQP
jgi:hypothetical protein